MNMTENDLIRLKERQMTGLAAYRRGLYKSPRLRFLFLELTLKCNEYCKHCGSSCGDVPASDMLTTDEYFRILDEIKADLGTKGFMLCITGGEPLLREDFFGIMDYASSLGFVWGMTTNATLIGADTAHKLRKAGMRTVSVSIDGLEHTHDEFRRVKGAYRRGMDGIKALINEGGFEHIQITTVLTHESIKELDDMLAEFDKLDIDSWRVVNLEPIGRAKLFPELLLTADDYRRMFTFIKEKSEAGYPVTYGCSHYLGKQLEHEVRDWYFICGAGLNTGSIAANGDIYACLDIERRPELIQGNIRHDRFAKVWYERFEQFRDPAFRDCEQCRGCPEREYCAGDSFHTWDFDGKKPGICFKGILF